MIAMAARGGCFGDDMNGLDEGKREVDAGEEEGEGGEENGLRGFVGPMDRAGLRWS